MNGNVSISCIALGLRWITLFLSFFKYWPYSGSLKSTITIIALERSKVKMRSFKLTLNVHLSYWEKRLSLIIKMVLLFAVQPVKATIAQMPSCQ